MATASAIIPYAVEALPPNCIAPAVNIGINSPASVPPIPANKVARAVNWFLESLVLETAGTIPQ